MLSTKFRFIWQNGFREDFQKLSNQKQELAMAVSDFLETDQPETEIAYGGHIC